MKIAVIGAGIVGVTTAFELGLDGHAVTVLERHGTVAEGSSFANGGILAPTHVAPWAAPGMRTQALRQWLSPQGAASLHWPLGADEWRWLGRWWRACRIEPYLEHRAQLHRLASYSRTRMDAQAARLGLEFERSEGCLVLLRTERDVKLAQPGLALLRDLGAKVQQIDPGQARRVEPALHADTDFCAAVVGAEDGVGNCRQFAGLLRGEALKLGVRFRFGETVQTVSPSTGGGLQVLTRDGNLDSFDAVVMCTGAASAPLLRTLGLRTAMLPLYGHSVSAPIRQPLDAPRSAVIDQQLGVTIARHGQRIRVAGGTQVGGRADRKDPTALRMLYKALQDWFPGAATLVSGVQEWKGSYAALPDGMPLVGASGVPGLWLNLGHGAHGWALACGSARVLADRILGHAPDIDAGGIDPAGRLS